MVFDGDCAFCAAWIRRWQARTGATVDYFPFQDTSLANRHPELTPDQFSKAVHLLETDGSVYHGAEAVFRSLAYNPSSAFWLRLYRNFSLFASASEYLYRLIAEHRPFFSLLTRMFWGREVPAPSYKLTQSIFVRCIGLIYLIAFISLWVQIDGLIGRQGVLPAADTMSAVQSQMGTAGLKFERYHVFPTFCWLGASDRSLAWQCGVGIVASILVIFGIAPAPCLFLLWLVYLSLCTVSREFLSFQWDILLLETGFLTIFLAPLAYLPWSGLTARPPSRIIIWLLRWLLFRLMFESGCVKLLSGDETWRNFTALTYHYETQPLPTWIGWYANQLPVWVNKASCFLMLGIELVAPFFVFAPRRLRHSAGIAFGGLQILIFLTGNYCFFNLLTMALCLALFDDHAIHKLLRIKLPPLIHPANLEPLSVGGYKISRIERAALILRLTVLSLVLALTIPQLLALLSGSRRAIAFDGLQGWVAPLRTFNTYGLFAVMTRPRYEIVVQGSNDGENWLDYEFKYKPGDTHRRPRFIAPHQPRLDWQMWFAALGTYEINPWFVQFCGRLLQNSRDTLALLETNPFPEGPPKYIRAIRFEYHFTDSPTRRATGEWWRRELKDTYLPLISLRQRTERDK